MRARPVNGRVSVIAAGALLVAVAATTVALSPTPPPDADPNDPEADGPQVGLYDAGEATIEQRPLRDSRFFEMPIPLRGVVAVPPGDGPFPVVVVIHGNYPFCDAPVVGDEPDPYPCPPEHDQRQFEGFGELATGLAAHGYLTLVPDLAPEYTNGFGQIGIGDRAIDIVDAHLDVLAEGAGMPFDLTGAADPDWLALTGHSRGGPIAIRYLTDGRAEHDVSALALVTPAYVVDPESPARVPDGMPVAVVVANCDGDVGPSQPRQYLRDQLEPMRSGLTLVDTIAGGTHNAISTSLEPDRAPGCSADEVMDAALQREREVAFLAGFLDMARALERTAGRS